MRKHTPIQSRLGMLLTGILLVASASQVGGQTISPLQGIAAPHSGTAMHEGSWDRTGGNHDYRSLAPGETITLLDHDGAGTIERFWCTIAPRSEFKIHRQLILRMYWDGEKEPSVECPIGDFFGVGFGLQRDYISLPLNETSGGYNCYWPMPFFKHAKWTLENRSDRNVNAFYYNIDYVALDKQEKGMRTFHACWRRENPTSPDHNYTILEAEGDGHYVGCALFIQGKPRSLGYVEGDEMMYIDGRTEPTPIGWKQKYPVPQINGTGTEDYFCSGWTFDHGLYSAPYHGVVLKDEATGRISAYRWHIEDAIPFHQRITVTIEHGEDNRAQADYSSVAYFYQSGEHKPYPPLPANADDLLPQMRRITGAIEAEDLRPHCKLTAGSFRTIDGTSIPLDCSGQEYLLWTGGKINDEMTIDLFNQPAGDYNLTMFFTNGNDYGIAQLLQNGQPLDAPIDLYAPKAALQAPTAIGTIHLEKGQSSIVLRITGKNAESHGTLLGIDALLLTPK